MDVNQVDYPHDAVFRAATQISLQKKIGHPNQQLPTTAGGTPTSMKNKSISLEKAQALYKKGFTIRLVLENGAKVETLNTLNGFLLDEEDHFDRIVGPLTQEGTPYSFEWDSSEVVRKVDYSKNAYHHLVPQELKELADALSPDTARYEYSVHGESGRLYTIHYESGQFITFDSLTGGIYNSNVNGLDIYAFWKKSIELDLIYPSLV